MSNTRKGFTLIELLVVIAIIAILAAILFPVFAKVREKARQTSCASNAKQIGLAFTQYIQDYDEKFPSGLADAALTGTPAASGTPYGAGWVGAEYSYIKSTGMLKCPDDSTSVSGSLVPVSYAFNANLAGQAQAILNAPTNTVLTFEVAGDTANVTSTSTDYNTTTVPGTAVSPAGVGDALTAGTEQGYTTLKTGALGGVAGYTYLNNSTAVSAANVATAYHTDGANYLATDGHVKFLRPSAVSPGLTAGASSNVAVPASNLAAGTAATGTPTYTLTFSYM
jgi:prepilin-type N-terminal cleavage/methylation domain-containing protein/prepilin-type processing-associated H-X9-DG protein